MRDTLIQFETAKLAKQKGFDERVYHYYYHDDRRLIYGSNKNSLENKFKADTCSAPTQSLLQKWLRDEYSIDVLPVRPYVMPLPYSYLIQQGQLPARLGVEINKKYDTYEQALEQGLINGLKLI